MKRQSQLYLNPSYDLNDNITKRKTLLCDLRAFKLPKELLEKLIVCVSVLENNADLYNMTFQYLTPTWRKGIYFKEFAKYYIPDIFKSLCN